MDTRTSPTRFGTVVRQLVQRIDRIWRNALDKRRAAQRSVRAWHALRLLNDATLRDIGLQRSDLTRLLLVDKTAAPKCQRPRATAITERRAMLNT